MKELNKVEFKKEVEDYLKVLFRKSINEADDQQKFQAVAYAVKDFIVDQWMATHRTYEEQDVKTVYYLSMEFLTGRALGNIIINLKGNQAIKDAIEELGMDLDVIEDQEPDAALGNGGLGRLAACFLDSLSTLGYPAYGCGIRYKYGMFKVLKMVISLKSRMTGSNMEIHLKLKDLSMQSRLSLAVMLLSARMSAAGISLFRRIISQ